MHDILTMALVFAAGLVLGLFYFGGLWLTVQQVTVSRKPALLIAGSWFVRLAVLLGGVWICTSGSLPLIVANLAGILVVRSVLIRRCKPTMTVASGGPGS